MFGSGLEELKQFMTSAYFGIGALITVFVVTFFFFHYRSFGVKKKLLSVRTLKNSEVLGIEEMQQKMLHLSELQKNIKWGNYNFLIRYRNRVLYDSFNEIRAKLSEVKKEVIGLIPASRWLVDNFQMIYRELEKVSDTRIGDRSLPLLQEGEFRGYPRIYVVAREMVELTGGRLSEENTLTLLRAYQKGTMFTAAELWALPEMLSHSLLENIIVVAEDILWVTSIKNQADVFVKKSFLQNPDNPSIDILLKKPEIKDAAKVYFHSHVVFLLKNMSFDEASIQKYLEYQFANNCKLVRPSNLFQQEGKFESCLEAKIRELLISLRVTNEIEGEELFEQLSILEAILRQDPAGVYAKMDTESRGTYRSVIEKLIVKRNLDEGIVARTCVELAKTNSSNLRCANHVGTYLVGPGYNIFRAKVLNKKIPKNKKHKQNVKGTVYFFLVAAIFTLLVSFLSYFTQRVQILGGGYSYALFFFSAAFLLFGIAIDLSNRIFAKIVTVGALPAMDFQSAIPNSARTFVVMPIIVFTKEQAAESISRLLKQYLGNQQENLYFALLVDFADAEVMHLPSDKIIEEALTSGINKINALYPSDYRRFSLFIRERKWNAAENCYMGWERKRGKLEEFNSLLSGDKDTSYVIKLCDERIINTFKYVITLDSDSDLLKNMAAKLVGIINHPLNTPEMDSDRSKLSAGYGIIQPAVSNHIYKGSLFSQVFSGKQGLDPYVRSIFDIYQDVFGEGIFVGKGIYEISVFYNILHQKFPENRVLSHDLLESCFVKTAFSCQAKIMEDYPKNLLSYAKREHRWIRGDWQLLPWLFKHNQLSRLSRWKILWNMLGSLIPMFKLFVIILSLTLLPKFYYVGLIMALFPDALNLLFLIFETLVYKLRSPKATLVYKDFFREIGLRCQRSFFELVFMPYMAFVISDAVLRTIYRLWISKQHLLNWNTAAITEKQTSKTKYAYYCSMRISVIMSVFIIVVLFFVQQSIAKIFLFTTLAILWGSSYLWAYNIGQEKESYTQEVLDSDKQDIRKIARKTWQFFKDYASSDNNWLCPDNYQEEPKEKVTEKTSPTNIGLQMLAVVSARDLGFETLSATICTIEKMLDSIARLPKWRGHLFNWYNIKTFEVLGPQYISTVDSGNFLGHLLTAKNGLKACVAKPLFSNVQINALRELGELCQEELEFQESYATVGEFATTIKNAQKILEKKQVNSNSQDIFADELLKSMDALLEELDILNLEGYSCTTCPTLKEQAANGNKYAQNLAKKIAEITKTIDKIVTNADFRFLYNKKRALFHIGYHVSSKSLDGGCYDLIASECLLTSVLNIAQNTVPLKHWSKLGRPLTLIKGAPCFVSWSGTMFEYLMPSLVLQEYEGSVFSETARAVVAENIAFAKKRMLPCWGISESQYYQFDQDGNYQYRAFGVHSLRLQTSLGNQNLVVAPYATMLALRYADKECIENLKKLAQLGCVGTYGYYEAIDFNGPNPVTTKPFSIVKSFMAHHQGMILVGINNYLNNGIMQKRFHSEPMIQSVAYLLEEKRGSYFVNIPKEGYNINFKEIELKHEIPESRYVNKVAPEMQVAHFLSNDNYSILLTSDGDGFSKYKDMMLYRWRPNIYDCTGNYIFIKDVETGRVWSNTYNPTKKEPDEYQVIFSLHQAEFKRRDGDITSHTVVSLSPDYDLEIRKVTLTNHSDKPKIIELTSYLEIVANSFGAELAHPAFNKLFIENSFLEESNMFLAKRRGSSSEPKPYLLQMVQANTDFLQKIEYENDRLRFIGRNNTVQNPIAVIDSMPFSNNIIFSDDPIISMRARVVLPAFDKVSVYFITGVCASMVEAKSLGKELNEVAWIEEMNEKFRLQSILELKYLAMTSSQFNACQDLVAPIFYSTKAYRGPLENMRRNCKNQRDLWRFGISGDNPILLFRVTSSEALGIMQDVFKVYEYLRINEVKVDLVVLSEGKHGYMTELNNLLQEMTTSLKIFDENSDKHNIFILDAYQLTPAEVDLLLTVAKVVFTEETGIYFRKIKEER
ncbi:MAG: glucoamylase family protein [Acidaminococcaceae bacterium]|nr:glucoamylase family protein [Acidaminococcaceae bacterium]